MSTTCPNGSIVQQLGFLIVLLSIVMSGQAAPRPLVGGVSPNAPAVALPTHLFFNELLESGDEDNTYLGEQMKYQEMQQQQQQQQHYAPTSNYFANKWPSLHDLLLTADYDDMQPLENSHEREVTNSRLLARLHRLGDNPADEELRYNVVNDFTDARAKKFGNSGPKLRLPINLGHNTKKNVQYMSPCHFKICNMGRKRSVPSNVSY
ncbi:uncharacterized protein LOC6645843 isoform X2 [Drosophila willistoni]|uniref:GK20562 n=1 Tax=Drosophila willistoni TaxID=7260 RepID=B4N5F1_DROWI|nr:uncharacterized protein LOC6645843 isoform X2 [Drosophila willistoni]